MTSSPGAGVLPGSGSAISGRPAAASPSASPVLADERKKSLRCHMGRLLLDLETSLYRAEKKPRPATRTPDRGAGEGDLLPCLSPCLIPKESRRVVHRGDEARVVAGVVRHDRIAGRRPRGVEPHVPTADGRVHGPLSPSVWKELDRNGRHLRPRAVEDRGGHGIRLPRFVEAAHVGAIVR